MSRFYSTHWKNNQENTGKTKQKNVCGGMYEINQYMQIIEKYREL